MIELFDRIAKNNSPGAKLALLKEYPHQEELKTVLRLATDPFLTFGITDFVVPETGGNYSSPYQVLDKLSRRELTGNAAREALGASVFYTDPDDREVFLRIIRKDLRCGLGEKLVLEAYPGLIRQFEVMRAVPIDKVKFNWKNRYYIEPKYDGLRCLAVVQGQSVTLLSRNGKEFTSSDHLKEPLIQMIQSSGLNGGVFDGELCSGNFNQSSSSVRRKDQQDDSTVFHIFDFLDLEEWKNPSRSYYHRRGWLNDIFVPHPALNRVSSFPVESLEHAYNCYNRFRDQGYEGAIIKASSGIYRFKRHKDWVKIKAVNDVDLVVESLIPGEGKYYGMLGAVVVKYKNRRVSVGTGFSDYERQYYWEKPNELRGKTVEIQYHEETPDGSLRHPRFVKIRYDK